jgi:hypothetical protein
MTLYYPTQTPVVLIGSKSGTTRTSSALTAAYTGNTKTFETKGYSVLVLDVLYTTGAGETTNSIEIKLEDSIDRTNFYQLTNESASAGTSTLTAREFTFVGAAAATAYPISYRLDITYPFMKVSVKESGVVTNAGTIFVEGVLGGA